MIEKEERSLVMEKKSGQEGQKSQKETLLLLTAYAPFGKYEVYIKNELKVLSRHFEHIYIMPLQKSADEMWELPQNAEVILLEENENPSSWEVLLKYSSSMTKAIGKDMGVEAPLKTKLGNLRRQFSLILDAAKRAERLKAWSQSKGLDLSKVKLYSNWFVGWAEVLALLKDQNVISSYVCRAHNYDLYHGRRDWGYIFFRPFHLETISKVVCISQSGYDYLQEHFPSHREKVEKSYLGVFDHGLSKLDVQPAIQVVSCSNLIPVKRVHLIIEVLKHIEQPVNWIHFGDGPLEKEIKGLAKELPDHIQYQFPGRLPNKELMRHYQETHVDFLINVSDYEGLPVSIMESISLGIPVVATDVGGTREIVKDETGLLIPENFDPKTVAIQIVERLPKWRQEDYRARVRAFWEENFDAEKNFQSFIHIIQQL